MAFNQLNSENYKPHIFWITGLSGSGKTTVSFTVHQMLKEAGYNCCILDGDVLRKGLCSDLGFSDKDRSENTRRAAELANVLNSEGFICICALISPTEMERSISKKVNKEAYKQIYLDCSLEACEKRDVKGLYKKARAGEIKDFIGIWLPYEAPTEPDLILNTEKDPIETVCLNLYEYILKVI